MSKLFSTILILNFFIQINSQNYIKGDYGYLYCHMSDKAEYTAFAISRDGYNYEDIISGNPIMDLNIHARIAQGQRDAYITRSFDGTGYVMVNTDMSAAKAKNWFNVGIDLLKSDDLIHWSSVSIDFRKGPNIFLDPESQSVYKDFKEVKRVWVLQKLFRHVLASMRLFPVVQEEANIGTSSCATPFYPEFFHSWPEIRLSSHMFPALLRLRYSSRCWPYLSGDSMISENQAGSI